MDNTICLTDQELELLRELVEMGLVECSPMPTNTMKALAVKLNLPKETIAWIDRMLTTQ